MIQSNQHKTRYWDVRRGVIRTRKGGWVIGKGVTTHGYSLLDELVGHVSFFQVMILNITGRLPEESLAKWLEAAFICLSWPDPRIWCNQIGSLGGTTRTSPVAAVCAGTLAGDSRMYGPGTARDVMGFIRAALQKKSQGCSIEQIVKEQTKALDRGIAIPGFARPIARGDERVEAMQRVADALSFSIGPHLQLAYEIQDYLTAQHGEGMNLAGFIFAFLADQGFNVKEAYRMVSIIVNGGIHACYAEAADHPPESFLPLRCDDIDYCGKPERQVPPG